MRVRAGSKQYNESGISDCHGWILGDFHTLRTKAYTDSIEVDPERGL
jgi:hypothetical protein